MNHGSLFSGIGGFDMAAEWAGWNNKFHCEWNEFGRKVLNYYWPESKSYGDITKSDFTIWRGKIDILTGGFPCQPYSQAGKRLGKEDERHLWPEMLRSIREIRPAWVVGENVYGLVNWSGGLVFEEVQTDLEAEGYEVQPVIIPACGVGAPHKRERIWFVAHSKSFSRVCSNKYGGKGISQEIQKRGFNEFEPFTDTRGNGCKPNNQFKKGQQYDGGGPTRSKSRPFDGCRIIANTNGKGFKERICGRIGSNGNQARSSTRGESSRTYTKGYWEEFPTQSPICSGDDGISNRLDGITFPKWRAESIKAYGNAIVPQVAYEIFKVINQMELKPLDIKHIIK